VSEIGNNLHFSSSTFWLVMCEWVCVGVQHNPPQVHRAKKKWVRDFVNMKFGQTSPNVIKCIVEDAVTMNYREDMDADQLAAAIAQLEGRPSLASAQSDELEVHKNSPLQKMTFAII
jgi:hypothetical protein